MSSRGGKSPKKGTDHVIERSNDAACAQDCVLAYEPPVQGKECCEVCKSGEDDPHMILCDRCNCGFHIYCLTPPLSAVPAGDWFCVDCLGEKFGFGAGSRMTYGQYARTAHALKRAFFEELVGKRRKGEELADVAVAPEEVEWQFWNCVQNSTQPLEVLYASDLDSLDIGSGFPRPTDTTASLQGEYTSHSWNVNNIGSRSLLSHLGMDISGMVVPWLYFGMLFSSFCWHVEDHLAHSVNYMHFGAPKTWYGVPGADADRFEEAMRKIVPDVFEHDTAVLYKMVTMVPPSALRARGVHVNKLRQLPGTFVVTWPSAFHAGFSHGLNCAESTNFAAPDWLPWGAKAAQASRLNPWTRALCFSHEVLLCRLAEAANDLDVYTLGWLLPEMTGLEVAERDARARVARALDALPEDLPPMDESSTGAEAPLVLAAETHASDSPRCSSCGYDLALSFVRCTACGWRACLDHALDGGAVAPCPTHGAKRTCLCLEEPVALARIAELRAAVTERADAYVTWRESVRCLRGHAVARRDAALRGPGPGARERERERGRSDGPAAPAAAEASDTLPAAADVVDEAVVVSEGELAALVSCADQLPLDRWDPDSLGLRTLANSASSWARAADAHLRDTLSGTPTKLPGGGRGTADSLRDLVRVHDELLAVADHDRRGRLGRLLERVDEWRGRARALASVRRPRGWRAWVPLLMPWRPRLAERRSLTPRSRPVHTSSQKRRPFRCSSRSASSSRRARSDRSGSRPLPMPCR